MSAYLESLKQLNIDAHPVLDLGDWLGQNPDPTPQVETKTSMGIESNHALSRSLTSTVSGQPVDPSLYQTSTFAASEDQLNDLLEQDETFTMLWSSRYSVAPRVTQVNLLYGVKHQPEPNAKKLILPFQGMKNIKILDLSRCVKSLDFYVNSSQGGERLLWTHQVQSPALHHEFPLFQNHDPWLLPLLEHRPAHEFGWRINLHEHADKEVNFVFYFTSLHMNDRVYQQLMAARPAIGYENPELSHTLSIQYNPPTYNFLDHRAK
jgi:hypothetical protein